MDQDSTAAQPATPRQLLKHDNVFITGATGVLGSQLLKQLLSDDRSNIYCLVRAPTEAEGRERLLALLKSYDPEQKLNAVFARRVTPVLGDISVVQFGLTNIAYSELASVIDISIHVAAYTNLFARFDIIETINVNGTKNMIAFSLRTKQKCLNFVSTFTVMGDKAFDKDFIFREEHLDVGQGFADMTYQKTKFICENLIRDAAAQGLVWNIMRPGQIFGTSDIGLYPQGQTNVSGLFYDIFKTIMETKVAFQSAAHFDIAPVDYVARGLLQLSLYQGEYSNTYHLTNPDVKTYSDVVRIINSFGYNIGFVPQNEYSHMLKKNLLRHGDSAVPYSSITTKAFRWWYSKGQFDYSVSAVTDASYTQNILAQSGIVCAPIDEKLVGTYVRYGIRNNYFPLPTQSTGVLEQLGNLEQTL